jgi:hypothetical protein
MLLNKLFGKLSIGPLINDLQKEILDNESKIKSLREVKINFILTKLILETPIGGT